MAGTPEWFTTEVLRRLKGVRRGAEPGQFYARCPAHDDDHASLAIRAGDHVPLIYWCHALPGCELAAVRSALAALGVPDEYLGQYATPEYEARRQARGTSDDWREIERLRNEMRDLKGALRGMLSADLTLAMLKVRLLAVTDGTGVPAGRKEYVALAMKAGVSQPRAYAAWKSDPLTAKAQPECVSGNHVVLAQPGENRQASQATGDGEIIEARKAFSEREEENSRNDNSTMGTALKNLRDAGLTKPAA